MKHIITTLLMLSISHYSIAQIEIPAMSPRQTTTQKVGLTDIEFSYSRPSLRGRQLLGEDGILPLNQKWRTGANAVTKMTISSNIFINDHELKKGSYALLSTPTQNDLTLYFYTYKKQSWSKFIDETPVLEISLPKETSTEHTESLSINFDNFGLETAEMKIQWGKYKYTCDISIDGHENIMDNINKTLNGPTTFNYFQAALYMHETQTNLPLALEYIQKCTKEENALFFQVHREALILKDLKKYEQALAAAERSKQLSIKSGNKDFERLNDQLIKTLQKR